jgi:hypothetical protein
MEALQFVAKPTPSHVAKSQPDLSNQDLVAGKIFRRRPLRYFQQQVEVVV